MFKKIYLEIINYCNLNCPFCLPNNQPKKQMALNEFKIIIDKIKGHTKYLYLHIKGEPFLHEKLYEFIDYANLNQLHLLLTTNATLLYQDVMKILEQDIYQINLSLHNLFIHENYEFNFKKLLKFLNKARLTKININLRFWLNDNQTYFELNNKILEDLSQYYQIFIDRKRHNGKLIDNIFYSFENEFKWPRIEDDILSLNGSCRGGKDHLGILVNGDVVLCCLDDNGETNLGNIFESDLESILNNEKYKSIINSFNENKLAEELCKRCQFLRRFTN